MKILHLRRAVACGVLGAAFVLAAQPPATPKRPVTDVYHGVKVVDDYRWLEDFNDPAVREWADAQTVYARSYLDAVPARMALYEQLKRLLSYPSPAYYGLAYRGDVLFAMKSQPPKEQPFLITLESPDKPASERVMVDPNRLDARGTTAIDFYVPSTDGKLVAVSLSEGGSESGDVHVYEVATGKALADVIPRVNGGTAGGSLAWNADGSGFYYTRYPRGSGASQDKTWASTSRSTFTGWGRRRKRTPTRWVRIFRASRRLRCNRPRTGATILAAMANGDGGEFAHYLLGTHGEWRQITRLRGPGDARAIRAGREPLPAVAAECAARQDPAAAAESGELAEAQVVVPESKVAIESFLPAATHALRQRSGGWAIAGAHLRPGAGTSAGWCR